MPLLIPMLIGALATAMASMVGRLIIALGIGFVTYKGIDLSIASLKTQAMNGVNALPSDALNLVGYLWIDKALSVIFSAVVIALSMKLIGGSIKKAVFK